MADHEDYFSGEAPAAHAATHENGGADEISVAGLAGLTEELVFHAANAVAHQDAPALIAAHAAIAAAHHARYTDAEAQAVADAQILIHKGDAAAHHARYTDAEAQAVADTQIATHSALPTVHQDAPALIAAHAANATAHQDAPALIATHATDEDSHHSKFTITEHDVVARHPLANLDPGICSKVVADTKIEAHRLTSNAHHSRYTDDEARATFPVGAIMSWPTEFPPYGWLECAGAAISRNDYSNLFGILGVIYGNGDGSTTFNLPDFRGCFFRGWDHGAGVDPDAATRTDRGDGTTGDHVGTKQADDFKSHYHIIWRKKTVASGTDVSRIYGSDVGDGSYRSDSTGGNETRPVNVNVMWIIKY